MHPVSFDTIISGMKGTEMEKVNDSERGGAAFDLNDSSPTLK